MKKSLRSIVLVGTILVAFLPAYAAPSGTNPHPRSGVTLSVIVNAVLSVLGL